MEYIIDVFIRQSQFVICNLFFSFVNFCKKNISVNNGSKKIYMVDLKLK